MTQRSLLLATAFVVGLFFATYVQAQSGSRAGNRTSEPAGVAVIELFTSQGCSSCPPADRVLAQLSKTTATKPVYVLSFHVDYWNYLGWEDPYSLAVSTARQKTYARAWSSPRVYTPQMVVNGEHEFNGGNQRKADAAISDGLQRGAKASVSLSIADSSVSNPPDANDQTLRINYRVTGQADDCFLNLAVVTSPTANVVPRGENSGRKLAHVNIVRAFKVAKLEQAAGTVELTLPADVSPADTKVIGYIQRRDDAVIIGASAIAAR